MPRPASLPPAPSLSPSPAGGFICWPEIQQFVGHISRVTLWRLERAGKFPQRRRISPGRVGWLVAEVEAWIAECALVPRSADDPIGQRLRLARGARTAKRTR